MAKKLKPSMEHIRFLIDRNQQLELIVQAWTARYWEAITHGKHIPSDEDRIAHDKAIGNSSKALIEEWKDQPDVW